MKHPLAQVRANADRLFAARDYASALRLHTIVVSHTPEDYLARLAIADALAKLDRPMEAAVVYEATSRLCIDGGQPLVAAVAARALEALGPATDDLQHEVRIGQMADALFVALAEAHGRGSPRLAEVGARLAIQHGKREVNDRELRVDRSPEEIVAAATRVGSDLRAVGELPLKFPPVPILGRLKAETLVKALEAMVVHRLPASHVLIREGERGTSCYLVATGRLRVMRKDDAGEQRQVATIGPNGLVGEMALITGSPRLASVQVVEPADVLELGPDALAAIGDELDELAPVLDRMARHRWMRNLLEQSPLFRIFTPEQHKDLLKRCSAHEVPAGTVLFRQGEAAKGLYMLLKGEVELTRAVSEEDPSTSVQLQAGAVAGVESVLDEQPCATTAATIAPSTVLFLSRRMVDRLVQSVPEFADAVRQVAAYRRRITLIPE